jgi:signal transduction histidine kinase
MARLVDALLTLARLQRGAARPLLALIPVKPLLEGILGNVRVHPGVEIVLSCPDEVAFVGDEGMAREAIANVVDNAASHTRAGKIRLTARRNGEDTVIEIADTGPGIPQQVRERVFERFFQTGRTDGRRGAGLGLAIAAEATRANGGTLELVDASSGTTFRFTFPGAKLL